MQESINKDLEELKNKHTETSNIITEIKNTLEGINSRIAEAEECISELEDKMVYCLLLSGPYRFFPLLCPASCEIFPWYL